MGSDVRKNIALIFALLVALMVTGCTNFNHLSDGKEVWLVQKHGAVDHLMHCRLNEKQRPICEYATLRED